MGEGGFPSGKLTDNQGMERPASELVFFRSEDGRSRIEVRLADENVWLTQAQLAELYQVSKSAINQHLAKIYDDGELQRSATVKRYLTVRLEGSRAVERHLEHFNLEAILAVG